MNNPNTRVAIKAENRFNLLVLPVTLIALFLTTGCIKRTYEVGEEGTVSRAYYDTCMDLIDIGKQVAGSIRSDQIEGAGDVCGCQAELLYKHGVYILKGPRYSNEFRGCVRNLVARNGNGANETINTDVNPGPARSPSSLPLLPILLGIGVLGVGGLLLVLLKSEHEE